jgi:tetratricopeptide (TPR) repeat protein
MKSKSCRIITRASCPRQGRSLLLVLSVLVTGLLSACSDPVREHLDEAQFFMKQREWKLAEKSLQKALDKKPEHAQANNLLGLLYQQTDRHEQSLDPFKIALDSFESDSDKATVTNNIGLSYDHLGQTDKAIEYYQKALEIDARSVIALVNLGTVYVNTQDFAQAIELFRQALELQSDHGPALKNLAETCLYAKRWEEAIQTFNKLRETYPPLTDYAFCQMAYAYYEKGDLAMANRYYGLSLGLNPESSIAHAGYALVLAADEEDEERFAKAFQELDLAEKLNPQSFFVHRNRGLIQKMAGNEEEALASWRKALEIDPNHTEILAWVEAAASQ